MRKSFCILAMLLLVASQSFASVGIKVDGTLIGTATDFNFEGAGGTMTINGSNASFNIQLAGFANGGAVSMATNETTVSASYALIRKAIAAGTSSPAYKTGTLPDGKPGQMLEFRVTTVGASGIFTITPTTSTTLHSVAFDAADEFATFLYLNNTVGWVVLESNATVNHL